SSALARYRSPALWPVTSSADRTLTAGHHLNARATPQPLSPRTLGTGPGARCQRSAADSQRAAPSSDRRLERQGGRPTPGRASAGLAHRLKRPASALVRPASLAHAESRIAALLALP